MAIVGMHPGVSGQRAFTLLETIVALFILVVSALFTAQFFRTAARASGQARDESLALLLCQRRLQDIREWARERRQGATGNPYRFNGAWPDGVPDDASRDGPGPNPAPVLEPDVPSAPFARSADADNPRFLLEGMAWRYVLHAPARGLTGVRSLVDSARVVKVSASWGDDSGAVRSQHVALVAVVREPPRRIEQIEVTVRRLYDPDLGVVPKGEAVMLTANGMDSAG